MNEETTAYQAYYAAAVATPYDAHAERIAFEAWRDVWLVQDKKERAYKLLRRMASEHPLESFFTEDGMGNSECFFCGGAYYKDIPHKPSCLAVLIQEFRP